MRRVNGLKNFLFRVKKKTNLKEEGTFLGTYLSRDEIELKEGSTFEGGLYSDAKVKITDFGLSRLGVATPASTTSEFLGTPLYASPEQFQGEELDSRCDIYSFGVILYEMLAGTVPFSGRSIPELYIRSQRSS